MIRVWNRINSPVMTEENMSVWKENMRRTWSPMPCHMSFPKGHITAVFTHRREWGSQCVPRVLSACLLRDKVARIQAPLGVSCCFHYILYTPPAFWYLFFVSVFHVHFFSASFYRVVLPVTQKHLSVFQSYILNFKFIFLAINYEKS